MIRLHGNRIEFAPLRRAVRAEADGEDEMAVVMAVYGSSSKVTATAAFADKRTFCPSTSATKPRSIR